MNLIILGPPGSGKGTQAELLCEKYKLKQISSGELLRQAIKSGDPRIEKIRPIIESGGLPNFHDFSFLVEKEILANKAGFVLDGTPRSLDQCEYLEFMFMDQNITIDCVIYLKLSHDESIKRLMIREDRRKDDDPETIRHRMVVYDEETLPVIEFYRQKGLLVEIDGTPDIQTIFADIVSKLETI